MKLTICDRCGRVIENYNGLGNTATISDTKYELCSECVNHLMRSMKLDTKDNCDKIVDAINDLSGAINDLSVGDMTNREKINKMSNEEFIDFIQDEFGCRTCSEFNTRDKRCKFEYNCKKDCRKHQLEWFSQEAELNADEMFEELGYEKLTTVDNTWVTYIKDAEDKAIHKKIEELKNA